MNYLYLGDCLNVLQDNIKDESVDLIYIDPPFNSKRDYNIFFDDKEIQTQRIAFEDTWTLKNIQDSLQDLHTMKTENLYDLLMTYQKVAPHAFPYLVMMSLRIVELHRVLKPTGSFYLHCDSTMSHYLKSCCDIIFSENNFRNEINWLRTNAHNFKAKYFAKVSDIIFFYTKTEEYIWNNQYSPYSEEQLARYKTDPDNGKLYKAENLTITSTSKTRNFEWRGNRPPENRVWGYSREKLEKLWNEGKS